MGNPNRVRSRGVVGELWAFMRVRKKFWLAPILVALLALGLLVIAANGAGVLSPLVYMF